MFSVHNNEYFMKFICLLIQQIISPVGKNEVKIVVDPKDIKKMCVKEYVCVNIYLK